MSNITMDQVAVMGVQYFHYTLDYYLNSMHRCGVKNLDLWGASPHYCRLDYLTSSAAERKLREIRKKAEDLGLKFVMYTPETLAYPYSLSAPEQPIRDRTIDYFDMAIDDALTLGTTRLFILVVVLSIFLEKIVGSVQLKQLVKYVKWRINVELQSYLNNFNHMRVICWSTCHK